jgi:hypothetical protein
MEGLLRGISSEDIISKESQFVHPAPRFTWSFYRVTEVLLDESRHEGNQQPHNFTWPRASRCFVPSKVKYVRSGTFQVKTPRTVSPPSYVFDYFVQLLERCKKCTGDTGAYSECKQNSVTYFTFTLSAAKLSFHSTMDSVRTFWRHTIGYPIHNQSGRSSRHVWGRETINAVKWTLITGGIFWQLVQAFGITFSPINQRTEK